MRIPIADQPVWNTETFVRECEDLADKVCGIPGRPQSDADRKFTEALKEGLTAEKITVSNNAAALLSVLQKLPPVMVKELELIAISPARDHAPNAVQLTLRPTDGDPHVMKIICSDVAARQHHFGQKFELTIRPLNDE